MTSSSFKDYGTAVEMATWLTLVESDLIAPQRAVLHLKPLVKNLALTSPSAPIPSAERQVVEFRLRSRDLLLGLMESIYQLREALIDFAQAQSSIAVLTPAADLTTLGHWALMMDSALTRDSERLVALYARMNRSAAGVGATGGNPLALNRLRLAELLGFDGLLENSYDALQSPDLAQEFISEAMILSHCVARMVDDLLAWGSTFLTLDDRAPYERARGLAATSTALLMGFAMSERGPTGAGLSARASHLAAIYDFIEQICAKLPLLANHLGKVKVEAAKAHDLVQQNWADCDEIALLFIEDHGLSPQRAQALAQAIVQNAKARGLPFSAITTLDVTFAAQTLGEVDITPRQDRLSQFLNPAAALARRQAQGGAGPQAILAGMMSAQARIRLGRSRLADRHRALEQAEKRLIQAAQDLIAAP